MRLLIAEDDPRLLKTLVHFFEINHYLVDGVADGADALEYAMSGEYDGLVLDIMMPEMDGVTVLRKLRQSGITTPALFLSARTEVYQRVEGLEAGADDYLPKPYSMKELLSRVKALIRRTYGYSEQEKIITFGNISVNITSRSVTKDGVNVSLSLREFDLLAYLCEHKNTAVSKEKLLSEGWGAFSEVEPSTLAVHIRWLREKLEEDPARPEFIRTVYKVGYILEDKK